MWHLSDDYYLSPSGLSLFESDRLEWWKRYVLGRGIRQTLAMACGTWFDWHVKNSLAERLGIDGPGELRIGDSSRDRWVDVDESLNDEASRYGEWLLGWYKGLGAYDAMVRRLVECDDVWLTCDTKVCIDKSSGCIVRGLADLAWSRGGWGGIEDWKVKGAASTSGASPTPGWSTVRSFEGRGGMKWPGECPAGRVVLRTEDEASSEIPSTWGEQLLTYGLVEGLIKGVRFVEGRIEEIVCRPTGVRVVTHCGVMGSFDEMIRRYVAAWQVIRANEVITDEEKEVLDDEDWASSLGLI